jgi:integration host factor subunit beta
MVKSELIHLITERLAEKRQHLPLEDVELSVNQIFDYLSETLSQNGRIEIRGFGSFNLHYRPPRNAHNPKTGEKLATIAKYMPHFKPGKELRERVNESAGRGN